MFLSRGVFKAETGCSPTEGRCNRHRRRACRPVYPRIHRRNTRLSFGRRKNGSKNRRNRFVRRTAPEEWGHTLCRYIPCTAGNNWKKNNPAKENFLCIAHYIPGRTRYSCRYQKNIPLYARDQTAFPARRNRLCFSTCRRTHAEDTSASSKPP